MSEDSESKKDQKKETLTRREFVSTSSLTAASFLASSLIPEEVEGILPFAFLKNISASGTEMRATQLVSRAVIVGGDGTQQVTQMFARAAVLGGGGTQQVTQLLVRVAVIP